MPSSSERGLDKAGGVPLLAGTEWVLASWGWRPCLLAHSLGSGSRWMYSLGTWLRVPETQCPTGDPRRSWFPDYPQACWYHPWGLRLGTGPAVTGELFPAVQEAQHCLKAFPSSQFMVRCFTTLSVLHSLFCPFHWLFCVLVVVGEQLGHTACVIEGLEPHLFR